MSLILEEGNSMYKVGTILNMEHQTSGKIENIEVKLLI